MDAEERQSPEESVPLATPEEAAASALASLQPKPVEWTAHHERQEHEHRRRWMLMGVAGIAGLGIAIWQSSFLTAVLVGVAIAVWELRERYASPTAVRVDDTGVEIRGTHLPHVELMSYDIQRMPDGALELSVKTRGKIGSHVRAPMGDQSVDDVHAILSLYIPQERHPVPWAEWWMRRPQK